MIIRRKIARDLPWFDGHFPGRPVLPGVALLVMLQEILRGRGSEVSGFARVRFRHEVFPDDEITVETEDHDRFVIKRAEKIIADGLTRMKPVQTEMAPPPAITHPEPDPTLPGIELLLPHRGCMRFLDGLVASTALATTATAAIDQASPFAREALAPTMLAIEIAAQAAAAGEALARFRQTGVAAPREGRLVGASEVALVSEGIPVGRPLSVSIVLAHSIESMSVYDATIAEGLGVLATGRVSTYLV